MRLFVALELKDDSVRSKVAEVQRQIIESGADLKMVNPSSLHITLKFLGEVPDSRVTEIAEALGAVNAEAFDLHVEGVGVFPSWSRVNVVWVGSSTGAERAVRLQSSVEAALSKWGSRENRFVPHFTIFRVKGGRRVEELKSILREHQRDDFGVARFQEFQLKKSVLLPAGPVYTDVKTYRLV